MPLKKLVNDKNVTENYPLTAKDGSKTKVRTMCWVLLKNIILCMYTLFQMNAKLFFLRRLLTWR